MTPDDLAALHARCFETPAPWTAEAFQSFLQDQRVILLTAPGGFVLARVIADEAEVLTLAVAPEIRRQGTGARLVGDFLAEAAARGAQSAFLEVAETNTGARALYKQFGFAEVGQRSGYYRHPDGRVSDAVVLQRTIGTT